MRFRLDDKTKLLSNMTVLLALVFVVWTAGAGAHPIYGDASASSLLVDGHVLTDASSDGSSPTEDLPLQRLNAESPRLKLSPSALVQLAFNGPRTRLLSHPGLPQAPPFTL